MTILKRRFGFHLRPRPPYSFEFTVHKPGGWPLFTPLELYEDGVLWSALHIGDTLTGLRLSSKGTVREPLIRAEVFLADPPAPQQKTAIRKAMALRLTVDESSPAFTVWPEKTPSSATRSATSTASTTPTPASSSPRPLWPSSFRWRP